MTIVLLRKRNSCTWRKEKYFDPLDQSRGTGVLSAAAASFCSSRATQLGCTQYNAASTARWNEQGLTSRAPAPDSLHQERGGARGQVQDPQHLERQREVRGRARRERSE